MTERRYAAVGSDDGDGAGGDSDAAADDFAVGAGAAADADADAPAAVPVPAPSPSSCVGTPLCILVITCRRTSSIFVSDLRRIRFSRLSISFLNCFGGIMRQPPIGAHSAACVATKPEMPSSRNCSASLESRSQLYRGSIFTLRATGAGAGASDDGLGGSC